jgi:hypothetical protein
MEAGDDLQGSRRLLQQYKVFKKELYNFKGLYKFIQGTCTVFRTVTVSQNTPTFTWDSYGSV